ncbi:MAG TPA: DUF6111 family protein [Stellaceae bacterium]|jgi:hypothetical protein|nr:DUF6111 family protein [Stellaceae bacterium]
MGRVFLTIIVPLLLPTALYAVWRVLAGKQINVPAVWVWLTVAGLVLASVMLVFVSVDFGVPKDGQYIPPHVGERGTVVPGHIEPSRSGASR